MYTNRSMSGIPLTFLNRGPLNGGNDCVAGIFPPLSVNPNRTIEILPIPNSNKSMVGLSAKIEGQPMVLSRGPIGATSGIILNISVPLIDQISNSPGKKKETNKTNTPNVESKELVRVTRIDQPYQEDNSLVDYSTKPINTVQDLFAALPEDLYPLLRSRKSENSPLKLLSSVPPEQLPVSDLNQLKVVFDRPIELSPSQSLVIEHIPGAPLPEKISIYDLARYRPPPTWEAIFQQTLPDLKNISDQIARNEIEFGFDSIVPKRHHIFRAFELTPLDKVSVVIIGQDPYVQTDYQGNPIAQGLAFSVPKDYRLNSPAARSVQNILQVISNTIEGWRNWGHGCLDYWAQQGVLLLNIALTTIKGVSNHHRTIWSGFIEKVCKSIITINPQVIFVLWGGDAQKALDKLGGKVSQIKGPHPVARDGSFMKVDHFQLINYILFKNQKPLIDWNLEPSYISGLPPATGIDQTGGIIRKNQSMNHYQVNSLSSPIQPISPTVGMGSPNYSIGQPINLSFSLSPNNSPAVSQIGAVQPNSIPNNFTPVLSQHNNGPLISPVSRSLSPPITSPYFYAPNLTGNYVPGNNMPPLSNRNITSPPQSPNLRNDIKIAQSVPTVQLGSYFSQNNTGASIGLPLV